MIRQLGPEDAAAFADIRLEGLRLAPDAFGSDYETERIWPLERFAERLISSAVFGFEDEDILSGVAAFAPISQRRFRHRGNLWGMYVREAARARGIGALLVEAVIGHARGCAVRQLHLTVATDNRAAEALYEKFGFRRYGVEPRAMQAAREGRKGTFVDLALMVLFLDDAGDAMGHGVTTAGEGALE